MALPEKHRPVAQAINNANNSNDAWRTGFPNHFPKWWGKMLTSMVVALDAAGETDVRYVSSSYVDDDFKIAVVTDKLLLIGSTDAVKDDDAEYDLSVYRLSAIASLQVQSSAGAFTDDIYGVWPGRQTVHIKHPGFGSLTLPVDGSRNAYADDKLLALLPHLFSSLV